MTTSRLRTDQPFAIDGITPGRIVPVSTRESISDLLSDASNDGLVVAPVGGRGATHFGNTLERYDIALDLTGLNQVLAYHPTDLVLSVEAGATFADVSRLLGKHGQELPLDCPNPERATIGGLIASGLSGPRRYGAGSLRDLMIGITVAHSDGSLASAGGMVVKNVSGFDMMRLHHGALGELGVIVSVNFKVLPRPKTEATVLASFESEVDAFATLAALRPASLRPRAVVLSRERGKWQMAVRYDGRLASVQGQARQVSNQLGTTSVLEHEESIAWWQHYANGLAPASTPATEIRLGSSPAACLATLRQILGEETQLEARFEKLTVWPTLGAIIVRAGSDNAHWIASQLLPAVWADRETTGQLVDAPPDIKRQIDVYGPNWSPRTLEAMASLKRELDPQGTLNRGRLPGRI